MKALLIALLLLAFASATAQAEEIYRTVQPDGTVVFSDRPISADSQQVRVRTSSSEQERARATRSPAPAAAPSDRRVGNEDAELAAAREEQARLRAAACADARRRLEVYETSPRLFEELPDGGRRYLSDEEIVQARLEARRAVNTFCAPGGNN